MGSPKEGGSRVAPVGQDPGSGDALDPREAFFGGRTEAVRAHCQAQPEQHIFYDDFTSLYSWVNKNCKYPIGHPFIHTQFTCQTPEDWDQLVRHQSYELV